MKEPPDVIIIDTQPNPLTQWVNLAEYAAGVNDMYLFGRAIKMIKTLSK